MRERLEHTTPTPEGLTEKEYPERLTSPEEEITEVGLILKRAKTEVEEFGASGLQRAEEVALETGTKVDEETKAALLELGKEAELASQMLSDTLAGYLRIKWADFLEKNLPKSRLTEIVKRRNEEIISKKVVSEIEKFLEKYEDYNDADYPNANQAAEYFEKYKDLLVKAHRYYLEDRFQEAVKVHNQRKAEALSKKIIADLEELLKYDYDNQDFPQAMEAVKFFTTNKESITRYKRRNVEESVFRAVKVHLINLTNRDENSWVNALNKYSEISTDFLADKDIEQIGYCIFSKAKSQGLSPEELMSSFEGNLDLLCAGSRYGDDYDDFSPKQRVRLIEETYKKRGPSEYIAKYKVSEFDDNDKEKVSRPLFESYMAFSQMKILSQIEKMKVFYDQLSHEDQNDLFKGWVVNSPSEVADNIDFLNLNEEQKKLLVDKLLQKKYYYYFYSEVRLEKLGANKEEVFNELLKNDAALLFAHRGVFNPSPEQYKLLLNRITSDPEELEKTLEVIYKENYSYPSTQKLTEEELQAFQSVVEKVPLRLIFRFRNVFEDAYKQKRDQYFKELPIGTSEDQLEIFVRDVDILLGGWEKNLERLRALVVEAGEQKVTLEYIENLDKLGLKLPNRVMGRIKENVIKAEQSRLLYYIWDALTKNSSLEQIQREQLEKLEHLTSNADYFKAVDIYVLRYILKDRRFKTQFETYFSNALLNPTYRADKELEMFNYDTNIGRNKRVRPNYGYMSDNPHGIVGYFSETAVSSTVAQYGRIHIKFIREKVQNRTTVTFDDSLGSIGSDASVNPPTPSIMPHFTSIGFHQLGLKLEHASEPKDWDSRYLEVQYHWPLRTEAIDSIHISTKNGLSEREMEEIVELVREYNNQYPDRQIQVVKY